VRRALAVSALVLLAAGCGGRTSAPGPSGGASVAPASTALLVRVRTNDAAQWRTLARLLPENLPTLESLRGALGPETDVLALTGDEETPVVLTQPPNPAKLDSLLAKHDPPLVSEEVAEWRVVAPDRATIDRLKRARNAGSLVDTDAYKEATRDLSAPALVTFYADGAAATRALDRRLKTGLGPVPGLGRVGWIAAALPAAGVTAVVLLAGGGPLRFSPRPWNARSFDGTLTGHVVRDLGATRGLISAAATADGRQRALLRADLLIEPSRLEATSFQLEFLPSGLICAGRVTRVQSFGFDATCRAGDGSRRFVHATWSLAQGDELNGRVDVHA